jgi:hypothetical protein
MTVQFAANAPLEAEGYRGVAVCHLRPESGRADVGYRTRDFESLADLAERASNRAQDVLLRSQGIGGPGDL